MSDDVDRAQTLETFGRDLALRQALGRVETIRPSRPGICVDCADPIETGRLAARPGARRCLTCQEAHERVRRNHARG